jgi:O-antigen ligase
MYKYKQKLELNFISLGYGLIAIATIISFTLDPLKEVTIWGLFSRNNGLLAYLSLFLLIYSISHLKVQTKHISFMVHALNIVSSVFIIVAIFQFFGLDIMDSLWYKQMYVPSEYKHLIESINISRTPFWDTKYYLASSIFGQTNYFGAYCSIIYQLITAFALREEGVVKKILLMIGSIMLFTGTILAQSMGSIIAMFTVLLLIPISFVNKRNYKVFLLMCGSYIVISAVINRATNWRAFLEIYNLFMQVLSSKLLILAILMSLTYILLFIFRKRISKYRYILVAIVLIVAILIGAIGYIYVLNNVVESNMDMLSNRGFIWYYSNEIIKENFVIGYGPDNLYYNFSQLNEHKSIYMPNDLIDKPHNMYLQVMLDIGIFGLIGFMIILVTLLLKSNKAIDLEKDTFKNTYFKALILVILAYMVQGIVNDNTIAVQSVLYLIMGIGASLIKQTLSNAKLPSTK